MDVEIMRREAEAPSLAGLADVEGVAADLADAFTDDPAFDWFLRDDAKRAEASGRPAAGRRPSGCRTRSSVPCRSASSCAPFRCFWAPPASPASVG